MRSGLPIKNFRKAGWARMLPCVYEIKGNGLVTTWCGDERKSFVRVEINKKYTPTKKIVTDCFLRIRRDILKTKVALPEAETT
jgi:hypothetical protein